MTRTEWLKANGRQGRTLRHMAYSETARRAEIAADRLQAFKRNAFPSSRPWALTSEDKIALQFQKERFAQLLARVAAPVLP